MFKETKIERDDNLTKILDRLILYLRIVHSVDYYGCAYLEQEDRQPRRVGTIHMRGIPLKEPSPKNLTFYIKFFEERLKQMFPAQQKIADAQMELFGSRDAEPEIEKYVKSCIIPARDGLAKCSVCYKRFTSFEFAEMHVRERHKEEVEKVQWETDFFNNYLADPNRPCSAIFVQS